MRKAAGLCTLIGLAGCGDIIGFGGYRDQDGSAADAADGGGNTGGDGNGGSDGTTDTGIGDGAGSDVVDTGADTGADTCAPTVEDCTNGKDDDCNGLTDCMDSACTTGFSCVPPLPNGWAWAAYDQNARPSCAMGYGMPKDVEEGINAAAASCGCGCTTTSPSCRTNNLTITAGGNNTCDDVANQTRPSAAGCNATNPNFTTGGDSISVTGPAPSGGSCAANPSKSVPAVTYQNQGRTCTYAGMLGGGCANNAVCAPKAAPFTSCVSMNGMNACPNGFSVQHFAGTMITDTRGCSACSCSFNAGACTGSITFYNAGNCTSSTATIAVDGACHAVTDNTWRGYQYTPTNNASCAASAVNSTGSVTFSDLQTVCCTN